jgi:hypothetical protein
MWDEAVMMHRHVFEAVNRSLQDIMVVINPAFKFLPFGGLVMVFGSDFRQILPVVPRGTRGDVVAADLNHSNIWQHVRVFKLHTNMRVQRLLAQGGAHAQADATRQQAFAHLSFNSCNMSLKQRWQQVLQRVNECSFHG